MLDFDALPVPRLLPATPAPGVQVFAPGLDDFELIRVDVSDATPSAPVAASGPRIVLCIAGSASLASPTGSVSLVRGEAYYVTPDEGDLTVSGDGTLFIAAPGA